MRSRSFWEGEREGIRFVGACGVPVSQPSLPSRTGQSALYEGTHRNPIPPLSRNRLWLYRKKNGYSQQDVALRLGHQSAARISDYELGKRLPSFETALKLPITLHTSIPPLYPDWFARLKRGIDRRDEKHNHARRGGE